MIMTKEKVNLCNKRLLWPDITKVIGLYFMILGHGGLYGELWIQQLIYSFHMPLFFILSGIFFEKNNLLKSAKALLIPYFTMNIIMLLWNFVFNKDSFSFFLGKHIPAILLGVGYNINNYIPVCSPMWFFYVLFIVHLMINIVLKISSKYRFVLCLFSTFAIVFVLLLRYFNIDTIFPIDSSLFAVPFFSIGILMKYELLKSWSLMKNFIIICTMLPILLTANHFNGRIDMNTCHIGNNIALTIVTGFSGTIMIIAISKLVAKSRLLKIRWDVISYGASIIVGLNLWIISILKVSLNYISPDFKFNIISGLVLSLLIMLLCYPLIVVSLRCCPFLIGRKYKYMQ